MKLNEQPRVVLPLAPKRQKLTVSEAIPEAGAETTASVLNSLIKHLAATPEAQQQAHKEVTRILGDTWLANLDDEPVMPYIGATIKEILRKFHKLPLLLACFAKCL